MNFKLQQLLDGKEPEKNDKLELLQSEYQRMNVLLSNSYNYQKSRFRNRGKSQFDFGY